MRILVVCPHFEPDVAPTGVVITEIVHRLVDAGHEVHVITSLPWYKSHAIEDGWGGRLVRHEATAWGRITRVHPFPTDKRNIAARAVAFAGFTALAGAFSLFCRGRPDVVLVMSPPLSLGIVGWITARVRRALFVFNVQDIFPDVAVEVGAIRGRRVIRVLRWLERFIYRRSDAVTVLSDDLRENVQEKLGGDRNGAANTVVRVIPNFVDTERIAPQARMNPYRDEFGLGDRTVVMYAGNLGFSQPLELMVDAARELRHREDVVFVINGGGSARPGLEKAGADLDNLVFVDLQPADRLAEVLAAGDVHVIALRRGLARSSVPSKLYSILAAGRPVLASVDEGTEVVRVLHASGAGVTVAPEDGTAFIDAVRSLVDDPDRCASMGVAGRAFVEKWVSPASVAAAYGDLFDELRTRR